METKQDCMSCRVVGTVTFAGVGVYSIWLSRAAAQGSLLQKRITMGFGIGFLGAGILRWLR